jgi:hypothetical protein
MTCRPLTPGEADELRAKYWPKSSIAYPPIHLWTDLTYVYVAVQVEGKWIEVIKEFRDSPFSHIVEPGGIAERVRAVLGEAP